MNNGGNCFLNSPDLYFYCGDINVRFSLDLHNYQLEAEVHYIEYLALGIAVKILL
jgi:hypothetical protein